MTAKPALAACMLWWIANPVLFAHDPGLSSADVTVGPKSITVALTLNERDWNSAGISTPEAIRAECVSLSLDGVAINPQRSTGPISDGVQNVNLEIVFPRVVQGRLGLRSLLFERLPLGHREFLKIHDSTGLVLAEQMLRRDNDSCQVALAAPAVQTFVDRSSNWPSFLSLGVQHILSGYDHMLFLVGLLLVCAGFRNAAGVITWFTIAHTITLALSVLGFVAIPSRIVEPAVAASIVFVGVENILRPTDLKWRGPIAFCFGLIHGLGFASVLRGLGIESGAGGIIVPLISFNVGVEAGQLAVALAVLPVIFIFRRQPGFMRLGTPALSTVIAMLGAVWFLERTVLAQPPGGPPAQTFVSKRSL